MSPSGVDPPAGGRVDAIAYHLERAFGAKVPRCPRCGSFEIHENYARASFRCGGCGVEIADHAVGWVPADPRVRRPEEAA